MGLLVWMLFLLSPRWLRVALVAVWALFQIAALELLAAMQRYPTWQDVQYLLDAEFVQNTTAGLNVLSPVKAGAMLTAALLAAALWIHLATFLNAPVSTTHAIVGGVVGAGVAASGTGVVDWTVIGAVPPIFTLPS